MIRIVLVATASALFIGACAAPTLEGEGGPDRAEDDIPPGWEDECGNGFDDDSDGRVDEGCMCAAGEMQNCWLGDPALAGVGACTWGNQDCVAGIELGTWDSCLGQGAVSDELCDNVDNDCDGETDEGCECLTDETESCYTGPDGTAGVGLCTGGSRVCLATAAGSEWSTCGDEVLPAEETCDGSADEDCDGLIDEGCTCAFGASRDCYGGPDGTLGVGACAAGMQACEGTVGASTWGECSGATLPAGEACTGGADEDCDGAVDCDDSDCETDAACCTPYGVSVPVVPAEGEIMFVIDRSGSMQWPAVGTSNSRWTELETAMSAVLPGLSGLRTGLMTFPEMLPSGNELLNCQVGSGPDLGLALDQHGPILSRLTTAAPRAGDTPTPETFAHIQAYFEANPTTRERFVVLATDGLPEPNCGATVAATVDAIERLRTELGVDTFVLGIVGPNSSGSTAGIPALRDALNHFADAGGRARSGSIRYYEAVDGPALTRGLESIVAAATDCHVELATVPARPSEIEVFQGGTLVPASGYNLSGTRLDFVGAYCDAIQAGLVTDISVVDTCGG